MESTYSYAYFLLKELADRVWSIPIPHSEIRDRLGWGPSSGLMLEVSDLYQAFPSKPQQVPNIS